MNFSHSLCDGLFSVWVVLLSVVMAPPKAQGEAQVIRSPRIVATYNVQVSSTAVFGAGTWSIVTHNISSPARRLKVSRAVQDRAVIGSMQQDLETARRAVWYLSPKQVVALRDVLVRTGFASQDWAARAAKVGITINKSFLVRARNALNALITKGPSAVLVVNTIAHRLPETFNALLEQMEPSKAAILREVHIDRGSLKEVAGRRGWSERKTETEIGNARREFAHMLDTSEVRDQVSFEKVFEKAIVGTTELPEVSADDAGLKGGEVITRLRPPDLQDLESALAMRSYLARLQDLVYSAHFRHDVQRGYEEFVAIVNNSKENLDTLDGRRGVLDQLIEWWPLHINAMFDLHVRLLNDALAILNDCGIVPSNAATLREKVGNAQRFRDDLHLLVQTMDDINAAAREWRETQAPQWMRLLYGHGVQSSAGLVEEQGPENE